MSDHLPPEIVSEILTRLPVKSLLRLRCVCKPWLALIDSPNFVNSHLNRNTTTKSNTYCVVTKEKKSFHFHRNSFHFHSLDGHNNMCVEFEHVENGSEMLALGDVIGSVNGVVCLDLGELVLWNPSTRKHVSLPSVSTDHPLGFARTAPSYGFGYDSAGRDFKVVRVVQTKRAAVNTRDGATSWWDVKVFGLKSMAWTKWKGSGFPHPLRDNSCGRFAGGCLHWCLTPATNPSQRPHDRDDVILAFDISSEKYQMIPQPEYPEQIFSTSLVALEGSLGLVCECMLGSIDVWVMKEHGVRESWTRLIRVGFCHCLRPVAYSKNGGQVLFEKNLGHLVWYDIAAEKVSGSMVRGEPMFSQESFFYVESLIQLCRPSEESPKDQKKEEKKTTRKKAKKKRNKRQPG